MKPSRKADKVLKLYGGSVKVEYYDQYHRYFVNRKRKMGVTTVTGVIDKSRQLIWWATGVMKDHLKELIDSQREISIADVEYAQRLHMQRKKDAADLGTLVHEWAEEYINATVAGRGEIALPDDERVLNGVLAFLKWVKAHKVEFVAVERMVYSKKYDYIGTLDCVFTMKKEKHGIVHVGDFKTSKGIYDEMIFQVTAYEEALREEIAHGGEMTEMKLAVNKDTEFGDKYILRFDKESGDFEAYPIRSKDHDKDFAAFAGLLVAKTRLMELEEERK